MRRRQKHAYLSTWTGGLWIVGGTHSLGRFLLHNEKKESDHVKSDSWKVLWYVSVVDVFLER